MNDGKKTYGNETLESQWSFNNKSVVAPNHTAPERENSPPII